MRFKQFHASRPIRLLLTNNNGYSLIELMVGLAIAGIVAAGIMGGYLTICDQAKEQRDIAVMAMNQRGAVENIEGDFRMAGYDPENLGLSGLFGVIDVRRYQVTSDTVVPGPDPGGSPALTIVFDAFNGVTPNGTLDAGDTYISYRLFDESNGEGRTSLARDLRAAGSSDWETVVDMPREVVADNILAVSFAYAVDENNDGQLDTAVGGNTVWAIDSDNDNVLDLNLDSDGNGLLDVNDDTDNDQDIDANDTQGAGNWTTGPAPPSAIKQVRIWILARAEAPTEGYDNQEIYYLGDRILSSVYGDFSNHLKCSLLLRSIEGRNL